MANTPTIDRPKTNEYSDRTTKGGNSTRSRSYDPRGNSKDRAARKTWMLTSPQFHRRPGTEGTNVNCTHCGRELNRQTVQADRIDPAGTYKRENVQPACESCNIRRGNDTSWKYTGEEQHYEW